MRGFSSTMRSHEKPMRSKAPGPKFSTITSDTLINFSNTSLPSAVLVSKVNERLLPLSIVKYKASASGISRNWLRVTSPDPGRSTLITSAPYHANNWVQAGPACTCVKSMMRIPSNGLLILNLLRVTYDLTRQLLLCGSTCWVEVRQATTFGTCRFINDSID